MRRLLFALLLVPLGFACEPKLPEGWPPDGGGGGGGQGDAGPDAGPKRYITFTPDGGGYDVVLDSQSSERWAAVDLDEAREVPFEDDQWDLAFQRFHIRARGGASGDGGVVIATVADAGYAAVTQAPLGPYLEDLPDGDDENTDLDTVLDKASVWYDYEGMFHTLAPKPVVYVVKTDRGGYVKLKLDAYYDRAGTPAVFKLRFAPVLPP